MKKTLSTVLATALLSTASFATDIKLDMDHTYANAGIAMESLMGTGIAAVVGGGIPFMKTEQYTLSIEPELTQTLVESNAGISITTLGAYGAYSQDLNKDLFAKGRIGLIYAGATDMLDDGEIKVALGAQVGYTLDEKMDLTLSYNFLDGFDMTQFVVGVQYKY